MASVAHLQATDRMVQWNGQALPHCDARPSLGVALSVLHNAELLVVDARHQPPVQPPPATLHLTEYSLVLVPPKEKLFSGPEGPEPALGILGRRALL